MISIMNLPSPYIYIYTLIHVVLKKYYDEKLEKRKENRVESANYKAILLREKELIEKLLVI